MEIILIIAVALVGLYIWHKKSTRVMAQGETQALEQVNSKHGTHFSLEAPELVMTESPSGIAIQPTRWLFDPDARKICVLGFMGKLMEVIDFSYIRKFKVEYNERVIAHGSASMAVANTQRSDYKIVFSTTDLKRPTLEMRFGHSAEAANLWLERLELIFAGTGPAITPAAK